MHDPKKPAAPPESTTPPQSEAPRSGGFGAFAEVYRSRWAANHPNMRPRGVVQPTDVALEALKPAAAALEALEPLQTAPESPKVPNASGENKPLIENGKRLAHPWERR